MTDRKDALEALFEIEGIFSRLPAHVHAAHLHNFETIRSYISANEVGRWRVDSEYHEDFGDVLCAFFIGEHLQGLEWTSPLCTTWEEDWKFDRWIFKRVRLRNEDIPLPLLPESGEK